MNELKEICTKLDLPQSEILRRAVRIGLRSFTDAQSPGTTTNNQHDSTVE
jgi:hypothetical protein